MIETYRHRDSALLSALLHQYRLLTHRSAKHATTLLISLQNAHSSRRTRSHSYRWYIPEPCRNRQSDNAETAQIVLIGSKVTNSAIADEKDRRYRTGAHAYPKQRKPHSCSCPEELEQRISRTSTRSKMAQPLNAQRSPPAPLTVRGTKEVPTMNWLSTPAMTH